MEEHHILPRRYGGTDDEGNLVTLCASCHRAVESIYDEEFWQAAGIKESALLDTVAEFVDDCVAVDPDYGPVPKKEVYGEYQKWCKRTNTVMETQHKFTREIQTIRDVHAEQARINSQKQRCFVGLKIE